MAAKLRPSSGSDLQPRPWNGWASGVAAPARCAFTTRPATASAFVNGKDCVCCGDDEDLEWQHRVATDLILEVRGTLAGTRWRAAYRMCGV